MLPAWLEDETATVPDYDAFAGPDALERGLAELDGVAGASYRRIGTSRSGSPIGCLTIGDGDRDAIAFGLPHPNEPVGGLTTLHLAHRLAADAGLRERLGHRWHLVACIDPDGLRLNEGWLAGPFTREHYLRNFYRPAGNEQIEWTFPIDHKQAYFDAAPSETQALMRLIDRTRPALMGSLHNAELGGAYYYLSRREEALLPVLQELPERFGIPLDRGEPESDTAERYGDGVFGAMRLTEIYDAAEAAGDPLPLGAGDTSDSYATPYGTLTVISEVPYWSDPRVSDLTPTEQGYADALVAQCDAIDELSTVMIEGLERVDGLLLVPDSPFIRATRYFGPGLREGAQSTRRRAAAEPAERRATVAEAAGIRDTVHSFRLRFPGMFLRALEAEAVVGNVRPDVLALRDELRGRLDGWYAEAAADDRSEVIPIRSLVATQYGALLACARQLHAGSPD